MLSTDEITIAKDAQLICSNSQLHHFESAGIVGDFSNNLSAYVSNAGLYLSLFFFTTVVTVDVISSANDMIGMLFVSNSCWFPFFL